MAQADEKKTQTTTTTTSFTKPFNLLGSMAMQQTPVYVELLQRICQDYPDMKGKEEEMIEKYIHKDSKVWKRMVNKLKPKSTRSKSGYTIFLSDPVNIDKIKKANSDKMMKELNPKKGDRWKKLQSDNKELYQRYCNVAKLFNHKLIEFDDNNKEEVRSLIKTWMYNKPNDELLALLKNIKEPEKKPRKERKKKTVVVKKSHKMEDSDSESDSESEEEKEEPKRKVKKSKPKPVVEDSDSDDSDDDDSDDEQEERKTSKFEDSDDDDDTVSSVFDVNDTQAN